MSSRAALIVLVLAIVLADKSRAADSLTVSQATGGIAFTGTGPYASQFGTMDGLGISTAAPGVHTPSPQPTNGALYYTTYQITSSVNGNHTLTVSAVIKTNFTGNAASAMVLESCPSGSSCNTAGAFSAMSTTTPVTVMPSTANNNQPVIATPSLAIFVPDNDGASAFTGTGTVSITLTLLDENNGKRATAEIDLNSPAGETINSAIQLTLGTATGGLTISPATDYAVDFGAVNGLGIGSGAGVTVNNVSGGVVYATPYLLQPAYTDQAKTTATITVTLTANFMHPTVLQLDDAGSATGSFTQITTTPVTITSAAASRTPITRYLGLFVSSINGPGTFTGSDTATLTFTMTVP